MAGSCEMAKISHGTLLALGMVGVICLIVSGQRVNAQGTQPAVNEVAMGLDIAQRLCSECHVVISSNKGGWTDAPAFEVIANRPTATATALSRFIQQPHMHMLNSARPPREADAISAYIMSLRND